MLETTNEVSYPNVDGSSDRSLVLVLPFLDKDTNVLRDYMYVPGLRSDEWDQAIKTNWSCPFGAEEGAFFAFGFRDVIQQTLDDGPELRRPDDFSDVTMSTKTYKNAFAALIVMLLAIGCSKQASPSSEAADDSEMPEVASKKMTSDIDKMAAEVLQSAEKMEAAEWLKRYPKSQIGEDEEGRPILLAPIVARLTQAGAQRVVIEYVTFGKGELLAAMVVVLPTDKAARQKLFAMEAELSQLCQQTQVTDKGQKYLHYSFD